MPNNGKFRSGLWFAIKSVIAGSVVVSRTFAAPVPVAPNHVGMVDDWRTLGQQMRQDPLALPRLDTAIVDMIAAADLDNDLANTVFASYEMVDQSELRSLDAHWASVLTAAGNAALVAEFLNLRSELGQNGAQQSEADDLVWLAASKTGGGCDSDCNNGWGNADQCSPGNSGNNNNGENYQGGNTDGTADGSSNSSDNRKNNRDR